MSRNAEPLEAAVPIDATRYQETAWTAFELDAPPPDASSLSDRALIALMHAMMQYETPSLLLPVEASGAVESEWRRRKLAPEPTDRVMAGLVLALSGVSGTVIAWTLLAA